MSGLRGPNPGAFLAAAFLLVYFGARSSGFSPAGCEVLMTLPAVYAAQALATRALQGSGQERRFYSLLATSAVGWVAGQLLWALAYAQGQDPTQVPAPLRDFFFVGFLVPALAAAMLGPGQPRLLRPDLLDRADATLAIGALAFLFLRLVLIPNVSSWALRDLRSLLLTLLSLAVAAVASARFFFAEEPVSRRVYGLLVGFATTYGIGSALGNGTDLMPPPGSALDLVWFVPFFVLAAVPSRRGRVWERLPSWGLVLLVGPLPLLVDPLARRLWPESPEPAFGVPLPFALLIGIGCAVRLGLQESRDAKARARDRVRLEEERRSGRLDSLSAVTGPLLADLRRAMEMLAFRASNAEPALGAEASLVREQVMRAIGLTGEIETALGGGRLDPHREVDVALLLEQTLQRELDAGLPLRVRLTTGLLPPILAAPRSLAAAFRELARNAAQASPSGLLEVRGEREPEALVLRFADDGPGIPEQIRASVFDPFFTTGRAGAGPGLGLTLVHFVARELGGSVHLEPGGEKGGASIAMRLPLEGRRPQARLAPPLFLPALLTATVATLISITSGSVLQSGLARGASGLAAVAAAGALLWAARFRSARAPFVLLALGCTAAAAAAFLGHPDWRVLADWPWAAAVLLPLSASLVPGAGRRIVSGLILLSFLVAHATFVVMPLWAPGEETRLVSAFAGGLLRLGLAAAAAVLASRAPSDEARGFLETLSLAFALWAAGVSAGSWLPGLAPVGSERIADLAVVLPLLVLWRLGRNEAQRGRGAALPTPSLAEARDLSARAAS